MFCLDDCFMFVLLLLLLGFFLTGLFGHLLCPSSGDNGGHLEGPQYSLWTEEIVVTLPLGIQVERLEHGG